MLPFRNRTISLCAILAVALSTTATVARAKEGPHAELFRAFGPGGHLGVRLDDPPGGERGALVRDVISGSPAQKAGLKEDDLIVRFDGEAVRSAAQLARLVRETPAGRLVAIEIVRGGSTQKLEATLDSGQARGRARRFGLQAFEDLELPEPPDPPEAPDLPELGRHEPRFDFRWHDDSSLPRSLFFKRGPARLGIEYQPIQGQLAKYFKLPGDEGVLVTSVDEGGPAATAGVKAGDVVLEIDGRPIEDARDLRRAVDKAAPGGELPVKVLREGRNLDLKIKLREEKKASETTQRQDSSKLTGLQVPPPRNSVQVKGSQTFTI